MSSRLDRITRRDWALAATGLLFVIAGAVMMRRNFEAGLVVLTFFGLCLGHAVSVIVRKRRLGRMAPFTAMVSGGVRIRPSRLLFTLRVVAVAVLGAVLAADGHAIDAKTLPGIGWLLMIGSAVALVGLALGRLPIGHLQFDPEGITFGDLGGQAFVPWQAVTDLVRSEVHGNPAVLLAVDPDAITAQPAAYRPRLLKQLGRWRALSGADFVIFSANYGIDAPVLAAALARYLTEPSSRQELRRRAALQG